MDDAALTPVAYTAAPQPLSDAAFLDAIGPELGRVLRIARLLTGDPHVADDLVADAVARTLPRWRAGGIDDGPAYLRRVVVNLASRRARRHALATRRDHFATAWSAAIVDPETEAVDAAHTLRAVMRLPVRRRAVVVLRFYDDLPERQIAEVLGISVGTVKSQLSRALAQLRTDLDDEEPRP